jgi:FkbM family methyltransferase
MSKQMDINKLIYKLSIPFRNLGLGKTFPILRKIQNNVVASTRKHFINSLGNKMYLDEFDTQCLSLEGNKEDKTISFMKSQIKKGDVVLDLGANIGYYALKYAQWVGKQGMVYAFEPEPLNFKLLDLNRYINNYENLRCFELAVGNFCGSIKLNLINSKENSLFVEGDPINVWCVKLDDFLGNKKIDFVKIDIEGAEGEAILGMKKIIKNNPNIKILFEFKKLINKSSISQEALLDFLEDQGFVFYEINERFGKINSKDPLNSKEVMENYNSNYDLNKDYCTDIFAVRKE